MVDRLSLDVMFNLGDSVSSVSSGDLIIDWNKILNTRNMNTDILMRLVGMTDINTSKITEVVLGSIINTYLNDDKVKKDRLFKLLVEASNNYAVDIDFNVAVKYLL
jgi:hypothetical protein